MNVNAKAEVSQSLRSDGRESVERRLERLEATRARLVQEKRDVELALSELEAGKRDETAALLKRHAGKSQQIVGTMDIEARWRRDRAELIRRKHAIEEEFGDIKRQLAAQPRPQFKKDPGHISDTVVMLMRIETLLQGILGELQKKK
jgi:uncharacterized protein YgbK (DUF1537 family)